jgi:uncharacterized protein with HEPN domain
MDHDPRAWLWDVCQAADRITAFRKDRDYTDYLADDMLRAAVERQFEIIGEALSRLSQAAPELAARLTDLRRAIAMRNVLIHAYRRVDNDAVWQTSRNHLPLLRTQAAALLAELGEMP